MNSFQPDEELKKNYYGRDLADKSTWYSEVAQAYNKVRPRYKDELINFAIEYAQLPKQGKILEIGCGPGIATTSFASRGFNLLSLEPNLAACEIAKNNCAAYPSVEICPTTLEKWSVKPQEFDAVLAATSLHWVSPDIGYLKISQALKDGGSLILLWNGELKPSQKIYQLLKPIYQEFAPSLEPFKPREQEKRYFEAIEKKVINSGYFHYLKSQQLITEVDYSIDDYLLLLSTYSPYIALEKEQRQNLFTAIKNSLKQVCNNTVSLSYLSLVQVFQVLS